MSLPSDFVCSWQLIHPKDLIGRLKELDRSKPTNVFAIRNELPPADIYAYLGARFGSPNGLQNYLRADHSNNLIHWEWTFLTATGMISLQGLNFRTDVWVFGSQPLRHSDLLALVSQIKADFSNYGPEMSQIRKSLEDWVEFVNPYQRLSSAIKKLLDEVDGLNLRPEDERLPDIDQVAELPIDQWSGIAEKYSKGLGLCFGVRSMLPVMAESYVNLLLFALMRQDLQVDPRLKEHVIRQPIDIRVKTLHMNCNGFAKPVDYESEPCKAYHSLVNERNDLLHGNIVLEKLKFNEVYFRGTVPVFKSYRSMWERSIGVDIQAVGLHRLKQEVQVVEAFVEHLNDCLLPAIKEQMVQIAAARDLGYNGRNGRVGILFSRELVDFFTPFDESKG